MNNNLHNLITCLSILLVGLVLSWLVAFNIYNQQMDSSRKLEVKLLNNFSKTIQKETDSSVLVKLGANFIEAQSYNYASTTLKQATIVDPNYRDSWLLLGISQLKNNEVQESIKSLEQAERIDPIYPETYKNLSIVYGLNRQLDQEKQSQEKYEYLLKSYN